VTFPNLLILPYPATRTIRASFEKEGFL